MKINHHIYALILILFTTAHSALFAQEKLLVITSLAAQKEAVIAIAGEWVEVQALLPANASPETFSSSGRQMASCARAKLFFAIGVPMENTLLPKLSKSFPTMTVIHTEKGMRFREMNEKGHHHPGGAHNAHDPHVWLSIPNMKIHAENITATLQALLPEKSKELAANKDAYLQKLTQLQQEIEAELSSFKGETILVFHPAFGYYLEMAGMKQLSVEQDGHTPSAKHLAHLKETLKTLRCNYLFAQPQSNPTAAKETARLLDKKLQILSPLPEEYTSDMRKITKTIKQAF